MRVVFFNVIFTAALLSIFTATDIFADEVDKFITAEMAKREIPGLQLAIVKNNKIIKLSSYGLANIQDNVSVDKNTLFTINSITKAFTGVAVMQLVEQGKLDLTKSISHYLPNLPPTWQDITIPQLMAHTSGLPAILANDSGILISEKGSEASWALVQTLPNEFIAGSQFKYNQTNYLLIGKIIEKVTNKSFIDFVNENQIQRLKMKRTEEAGFANLNNIVPHSARRYTHYNQQLSNLRTEEYPTMLSPAVGMSSTANEIAQWVIALQNNELLQKKSSLKTLWTPELLNNGKNSGFNRLLNGYALGWPIVIRDEHPAVAPSGGNRGAFFIYPQDQLAIVVLTNLMGAMPDQFIDDIAGFYIPEMKKENGFGLVPTMKVLWQKLESNGYDKAVNIVNALTANEKIDFIESDINNLGYWLIAQKQLKKALAVFKLNTTLYPKSANTYDSLAETYWRLDDIANAISSYKTVVQMQPENNYAQSQLKKLKQLKQLKQ